MNRPATALITGAFLLAGVLTAALPPGDADEPKAASPAERIQPILRRCRGCHAGAAPAAGLDLATRAGALKGGKSGPALQPGRSIESLLYRLVAAKKMPPDRPLAPGEIELVRRWIDAGASWGDRPAAEEPPKRAGLDWWSLQPVVPPWVPAFRKSGRVGEWESGSSRSRRRFSHSHTLPFDPGRWVRNPIDAFVLARLQERHLNPAPPADRVTLIRRATFDLLGIPPTPAEIDAFVADRSPTAYEKLIDRLLASPHYGERWGRHWLDVARFAESQGFERDKIRDHAWRYRDYVIRSFNEDKPYPQFIAEQLAGDVLAAGPSGRMGEWESGRMGDPVQVSHSSTLPLPHSPILPFSAPPYADGVTATGFLVAGPWDEVGNTVTASALLKARVREEELEDMVSVVSQTFLGLTANCARCHDHKFDPIPQRDYYRLKAALEGVRPGDRPLLPPAELVRRRVGPLGRWWVAGSPQVPMAYAAIPSAPGPTFLLLRGDVEKHGEAVTAGGFSAVRTLSPEFDLPADAPEGRRRLALAAWIADPRNPLAARVMVNRVWHYHFGRGLVGTPNDFGFNGERPSHPELLDWLAANFVATADDRRQTMDGESRPPSAVRRPSSAVHRPPSSVACAWSLKQLHRLIMTSSTYRQSSRFDAGAAAVDAEDRLLWRFAPRRLEGEAIRDAMLCASGQINWAMGGPGFRPFTVYVNNSHFYTITDPVGPEFNRRTVYRINVNSARDPLLETLDCPDPSTKTPRRSITTTPLQALALMNNSFVLRQAREFAARVRNEGGEDPASQLRLAYRLALGRFPSAAEAGRAGDLARAHGMESACWALLNASEFSYLK
jgi:hypothetical protein